MKRSRVGALLAREARGNRIATSLKLDGGVLAGCKSFCEARGITLSELVEALLSDLLDEQEPHAHKSSGRRRSVRGSD